MSTKPPLGPTDSFEPPRGGRLVGKHPTQFNQSVVRSPDVTGASARRLSVCVHEWEFTLASPNCQVFYIGDSASVRRDDRGQATGGAYFRDLRTRPASATGRRGVSAGQSAFRQPFRRNWNSSRSRGRFPLGCGGGRARALRYWPIAQIAQYAVGTPAPVRRQLASRQAVQSEYWSLREAVHAWSRTNGDGAG